MTMGAITKVALVRVEARRILFAIWAVMIALRQCSWTVSQKIKKKLAIKGRHPEAASFSELETKFGKLKLIKNHASVLQFFLTYFTEQNKYESLSNKNVSRCSILK